MLQCRDQFGLGTKSRQLAGTTRVDGSEHLQRDLPVQALLHRLVDDPHAAPTQNAQDAVARHRRPCRTNSAAGAARRRHVVGFLIGVRVVKGLVDLELPRDFRRKVWEALLVLLNCRQFAGFAAQEHFIANEIEHCLAVSGQTRIQVRFHRLALPTPPLGSLLDQQLKDHIARLTAARGVGRQERVIHRRHHRAPARR